MYVSVYVCICKIKDIFLHTHTQTPKNYNNKIYKTSSYSIIWWCSFVKRNTQQHSVVVAYHFCARIRKTHKNKNIYEHTNTHTSHTSHRKKTINIKLSSKNHEPMNCFLFCVCVCVCVCIAKKNIKKPAIASSYRHSFYLVSRIWGSTMVDDSKKSRKLSSFSLFFFCIIIIIILFFRHKWINGE